VYVEPLPPEGILRKWLGGRGLGVYYMLREVKRSIHEFIIGDALHENLADVWKKNYNMYFKLHFNYMPSCIDCELVNWCSYTLSSHVDCWGNIPNCAHCPYHYKFFYCPL
jgi:hypothetical protein